MSTLNIILQIHISFQGKEGGVEKTKEGGENFGEKFHIYSQYKRV